MEQRTQAPGIAPVPQGTPTHSPTGRTFIGGKSKEFTSAQTKEAAQALSEAVEQSTSAKPVKKDDPLKSLCPICQSETDPSWSYCSSCGLELHRHAVTKALGIELTQEDVSSYLFKGYLTKEIEIVPGHKALFKTLIPKEGYEIDTVLTQSFKDKDVTQSQYNNQVALLNLSYGWISFDGTHLGQTPEERKEYLMNSVGVHLLDLASRKWTLFNRSVSAMLEDPDVIKN